MRKAVIRSIGWICALLLVLLVVLPAAVPSAQGRPLGEGPRRAGATSARDAQEVEEPPYRTYLPLVPRSALLDPARAALERVNRYRAIAGSTPLRLHPALVRASQNHANYYLLNVDDPDAWVYGVHGEVEGKPGFTGQEPAERDRAAGFPWPWTCGLEVMHFLGDPYASVDDWMNTVYHRAAVLDPEQDYMGYGYIRAPGPPVDVMDFGSSLPPPPAPHPLAYPADGQVGVPPLWGGGESPDPLPPGAPRPVGYPFTVLGAGGTLDVTWAEMRDSANHVVSVYPNPSYCPLFNCYALVAKSPLQPLATYAVHARGTVAGVSFDRVWHFTTGE